MRHLHYRTGFTATILALLLAAGWSRAEGQRPNCQVLSVGIDNYARAKKLQGCLNDARNTIGAFRAQQGRLFGHVATRTLLDGSATKAQILRSLHGMARSGQPGDFAVVFLSGHGSRGDNSWRFVAYDQDLHARELFDALDELVGEGRRVILVVDACYAGLLRSSARPYLGHYRQPHGGGLALLLSSAGNQTSQALGQYSAFAKSFADGMRGQADLNRDGRLTLNELARFTHRRTHELLHQRNIKQPQDSQATWSASLSGNLPLGWSGNPRPTLVRR